jgi:hypothetical protein
MRTPKYRWVALSAALVMTLAACSPATLTEQILEGQEGVGNVEIDEEDGTVKIEIESEDGEASVVIGGGEVPDGFPIPIADGGTVTAVMEQQSDFSVSLSYDGSDYDRVKAFYEDWIDASGFEVVNKFETSAPKSISWGLEDGDASYNITMSGASEETFVILFVTNG